tara:strand:- start:1085 stop:1633 length:549 start_codon:yes stop_codon:yes gene_type:complete
MKQLVESLPIFIFVLFYFYTKDIFLATIVLLVSLFLQLTLEFILEKKISKKTLIIFIVSVIFGGSTLLFKNEAFLFWRPTVINWIFAIVIIFFELLYRKNLLHIFFGKTVSLPINIWNILSRWWALGFFISGTLNIIIAYNFSLDFWVSYKFFGNFLISLLYILATIMFLWKRGYLKAINDK